MHSEEELKSIKEKENNLKLKYIQNSKLKKSKIDVVDKQNKVNKFGILKLEEENMKLKNL